MPHVSRRVGVNVLTGIVISLANNVRCNKRLNPYEKWSRALDGVCASVLARHKALGRWAPVGPVERPRPMINSSSPHDTNTTSVFPSNNDTC